MKTKLIRIGFDWEVELAEEVNTLPNLRGLTDYMQDALASYLKLKNVEHDKQVYSSILPGARIIFSLKSAPRKRAKAAKVKAPSTRKKGK